MGGSIISEPMKINGRNLGRRNFNSIQQLPDWAEDLPVFETETSCHCSKSMIPKCAIHAV